MPSFEQKQKQIIRRGGGEVFWRKITVTSSKIKTATKLAITGAATGDLALTQVVLKTDTTGLAGGTNFQLGSTNLKGVANIAVETIANLGASITKSYGNPPAGDTTTSDGGYTVTQLVTVIEAGANLYLQNSASDGTGAGTVDIYLKFERITDNAEIFTVGSTI